MLCLNKVLTLLLLFTLAHVMLLLSSSPFRFVSMGPRSTLAAADIIAIVFYEILIWKTFR